MKIEGHYLNGKTSKRYSAYLEVGQMDKPTLRLQINGDDDPHEPLYLDFTELKVETRLGVTPREISFRNNQLFVTDDNDAIDNLVDKYSDNKSSSLLHQLESKLSLVLISTVITIGLVWYFVAYGIPASAKIIANKMPAFATEKLGSSLDILDKTVFEPTEIEQKRQNEIKQLVAPYIAEYSYLNPSMNFRSGMGANALALLGGQIVFTDEFVKLAQNDEELLAVFFHELGHLKHKHLARRFLQDSMITLMVIFITGDIDTIDILTGLPTLVLDLSYSREFEIEADSYALEQMHNVGIPLDNFAVIMQRLQDYYTVKKHDKLTDEVDISGEQNDAEDSVEKNEDDFSIAGFLSTHPSTEERIKLTEEFIKKYKNISDNKH